MSFSRVHAAISITARNARRSKPSGEATSLALRIGAKPSRRATKVARPATRLDQLRDLRSEQSNRPLPRLSGAHPEVLSK
jgi:hypothetical protein